MLENILTLLMLILLQAVLGFDNLLYISLESKRVKPEQQAKARNWGIGLAIVLRLVLLVVVMSVIDYLKDPVISISESWLISGAFSIHSLIVLLGGLFIMYTAVKEISHMLSLEESHAEKKPPKSLKSAILMIILMNLVFSFDSILSAIALTKVFWVMAVAIVIGGVLMILLSGTITEFLKKNRMYEVLGLFILFVVGIMLITEGGHLAHLKFFNYPVYAMSKGTFYFVIIALVLTEIVQSRYNRKLNRLKGKSPRE
jgi:predicted tellurium resistance membrane protein TerC